jgi:phage shock protein PspC (stress-responsive transcriptional regulator)
LHRSGHDRFFGGVAGGLGEHLGVNAWWFRWAFVLLALFAGVGVLVYVLAWLVIPGPDEDESIVSGWVQGVDWNDGGLVFGIVLVGVAAVLLATQVVHISSVLILAAAMFIVGLLLYRGDLKVPDRVSGGTTLPPSGEPVVDAHAVDGSDPGGLPPDEPISPTPPRRQRPPKPPRERSMLGRLTMAIGLIVVASMALVDASDLAVDIEPFHYFAVIIAIFGIALLIGAWAGRARWLIIIGILIAPLLWLSMLLPTSWDFSVGEFYHVPASVQEVTGPYELGAGQMTIDLTDLSSGELAEIGTIEATLNLGEMIVRLPEDVGVEVRAEVTAGEVSGPFDTVSGIGIGITRDVGPEPTVLVLDLNVGLGAINISGPGAIRINDVIIIEGNN